VEDATRLNLFREGFTKKRTEAMTKFESLRQNFRNREKKIRAELEKAGRIWKELDERFRWWWWRSQSLP
jgi:hypothetical protein